MSSAAFSTACVLVLSAVRLSGGGAGASEPLDHGRGGAGADDWRAPGSRPRRSGSRRAPGSRPRPFFLGCFRSSDGITGRVPVGLQLEGATPQEGRAVGGGIGRRVADAAVGGEVDDRSGGSHGLGRRG